MPIIQNLTVEEIEKALQTVTDKLSKLDDLIKGVKILWFRCRHSGLAYPADYASEWGKKYGVGLGPDVVSETLNSRYDMPLPAVEEIRSVDQIMHPLEVTKSQMDPIFLPAGENVAQPVLASVDPWLIKRTPILREKQLNKSDRLKYILTQVKV